MNDNITDHAKKVRDLFNDDSNYLKSALFGYRMDECKSFFFRSFSENGRLNERGFTLLETALYAKGDDGYSIKLILKKDGLCYISDTECNVISDGYDSVTFLVDKNPTFPGFLVQKNGLSGILSTEADVILSCEYLDLLPFCISRDKFSDDDACYGKLAAFLGNKPNMARDLISLDGKTVFRNVCSVDVINSVCEYCYNYEMERAYDRRISETFTKVNINAKPTGIPGGDDGSEAGGSDNPGEDQNSLASKGRLYNYYLDCYELPYSIKIDEKTVKFKCMTDPGPYVKQNTGYVESFTVKRILNYGRLSAETCFGLRENIENIRLPSDKDARVKRAREIVFRLARLGAYGGSDIYELDMDSRTYNCLHRAGVYTIYDLCTIDEQVLLSTRSLGKKTADMLINIRHAIFELYPDRQNDPPYQKGLTG